MTNMLHGVITSTYLHKGSNMLNLIKLIFKKDDGDDDDDNDDDDNDDD